MTGSQRASWIIVGATCLIASACESESSHTEPPPGAAFDHPACPAGEAPAAEGELRNCGEIDLGPVRVRASPESLRRPVTMSATVLAEAPALPAGVEVAGQAVDITIDDVGALDAPLEVAMRYDPALVGPERIPVVLHWDDAGRAQPSPVLRVDAATGELDVLGRDFSEHTVGSASTQTPPEYFWTGFDPALDGWSIDNEGGPAFTLGGNCIGMSAFAAWYLRHPDRVARRLASRFTGDTARILAMRAQRALQGLWYLNQSTAERAFLHQEDLAAGAGTAAGAAALAVARLKVNLATLNAPQVMVINHLRRDARNPNAYFVWHHAILIVGYTEAGLIAYDPNYRASYVRLPTRRYTVTEGGVSFEGDLLTGRVEYLQGSLMAPGATILESTSTEPAEFRVFTVPAMGTEENFAALMAEADTGFTRSSYITMSTPQEGEQLADRIVNVQGTFTTLNPETTTGFLWVRGLMFPLERSGVSGFTEVASPAFAGSYPIYVLLAEPESLRTAWYLNSAVRRINVTNSEPPAELLVTLTWDTLATDLDLYLVAPNGDTMCWNCGSTDAGAFRTDDRWSGGPEFAFVTTAPRWGHVLQPTGDYRVRVHWYENAPEELGTTVTVNVIWRERVLGAASAGNELVCRHVFRMTEWNPSNSDPDAEGPDWYEVAAITFDPSAADPVRPANGCRGPLPGEV